MCVCEREREREVVYLLGQIKRKNEMENTPTLRTHREVQCSHCPPIFEAITVGANAHSCLCWLGWLVGRSVINGPVIISPSRQGCTKQARTQQAAPCVPLSRLLPSRLLPTQFTDRGRLRATGQSLGGPSASGRPRDLDTPSEGPKCVHRCWYRACMDWATRRRWTPRRNLRSCGRRRWCRRG